MRRRQTGGIQEGAAARSTSRLLEKTEISVRRNRADPLSRADARLKMARVTHLAAWRAAKAAVATWRAPIKVCVVVRWWERVRAHRRQTRKTRRDACARRLDPSEKLIRTLRGARYFRRSPARQAGTNLGHGSVRRAERAEQTPRARTRAGRHGEPS